MQYNCCANFFAKLRIGESNDNRLIHRRIRQQRLLNFNWRDFLSPAVDHFFDTAYNKRNNPASLFGKGTSVMIGKLSFSAVCQATVSKSAAIMTAFTFSLDSTFIISAGVRTG